MSTALNTLAFASAALIASAACTLELADPDGAVTPRCTDCGFNSPRINDAPFPELHLGGLANDDGVSLIGLRNPTTPSITYALRTTSLQDLAAYSGQTRVAYGPGLVGWQLVLSRNGVEVVGTIRAQSRVTESWAAGNLNLSTYAISFASPLVPGLDFNVCPTYVDEPFNPILTIIPGQTYDRDGLQVGLIDADWVTFACADEAAFKAKRLGYAQALGFNGTALPATRDQQDATIKMITADYCGTGESFTEQGTPLYWENTAGTVVLPEEAHGHLEAVWTHEGALCVDHPRVPDNAKAIKAACDLPSCDTLDLELEPHEWISWAVNP